MFSKALNHLFYNKDLKIFEIPKRSDNLNHLAYADDIIIFVNVDKKSLELIVKVLVQYKEQPGQKINKQKRLFFMFNKVQELLYKK